MIVINLGDPQFWMGLFCMGILLILIGGVLTWLEKD